MWRFSVILSIFVLVLLLSIYIFHCFPSNRILDFYDSEPFDNFAHFNDIESVENSTCRPFVVRPKQADLFDFVKPERFSCNSPMGQYASFSDFGFLTISEKLKSKRIEENDMNQTCVYTEIVKIGEHPMNGTLVGGSEHEITIEPGIPTKIPLEQFVVYCRDTTGHHFYNKTFFNFQSKIEKRTAGNSTGNLKKLRNPGNLMILSVSGMSHNQAMRHLKSSLEFAAANGFLSFSMFNQKTSNNSMNTVESFRVNSTNNSFSTESSIWNSMKNRHRCWTFLQTDSREFGAQFGAQFDYFPNFYNRYNRQHLAHVENCISDGRVIVEDDVTLWKNFSLVATPRNCYLSLVHLTEITNSSDGKLVNLDEILKISMEELISSGLLKNTTIAIMSDGGNRESPTFTTESGQLEAKYGLFLIRLSDAFREENPEKANILEANVDRLITNDNIAETLQDLLDLSEPNTGPNSKSLLSTEVPVDSDCRRALIDKDSCICSKTDTLDIDNQKSVMQLLRKTVEDEVSGQKCLEKADISMEESGIYRVSRNANFFKFYVILTTKTSKLADNHNLEQKCFKFSGTARFSTDSSAGNSKISHLELAGNLKNVNSTGLALDQIVCYLLPGKGMDELKLNRLVGF